MYLIIKFTNNGLRMFMYTVYLHNEVCAVYQKNRRKNTKKKTYNTGNFKKI